MMEENKFNQFGYVSISWLNYAVHYVLTEPVLQKVALIGSIASSAVYVYTTFKKHKSLKQDNNEKVN